MAVLMSFLMLLGCGSSGAGGGGLLEDNLIAEYTMTEGSGTTLNNTGSAANGDLTTAGSVAWSAAGLSFEAAGSYASGAFPSTALDNYSMYCVLKWDIGQAANDAATGGFCSTYVDGGPRLDCQGQVNYGRAQSSLDNNPVGTAGIVGNGMCSIIDSKWHMLASTRVGNTVTTYLDDVVVATETIVAGTKTIDILQWGYNAPGPPVQTIPATVGYMALYNTGHTKAQVRSQRNAFAAIMTGRGETMPVLNPFFVIEGDSMMEYSYNYFYQSALIDGMAGVNLAVAGSTVATMTARAAAADDYVAVTKGDAIISILVTNDLAPIDAVAATYVADLKTYCLARRTAGFTHINVCTVTPRDDAGFNTRRNSANALIRADPTFWDSITEVGGHALLGPDGAPAAAVYYDDGVHFKAAGYAIHAPLILGGIRAAVTLNGKWLMEDGTSAWLKEDGSEWLMEF